MLRNPGIEDNSYLKTFYGLDLIEHLARFVLGYEADEKAELKKTPTAKNATEQSESKEAQSISFRERLYTLLCTLVSDLKPDLQPKPLSKAFGL